MRLFPIWLLIAGLLTPSVLAGPAPERRPVAVVLDFTSPEASVEFARRAAAMLRAKLHRTRSFVMIEDLDREHAVKAAGFRAKLTGGEAAVAAFVREKLGGELAVWGAASDEGGGYALRIRALWIRQAPKVHFDQRLDGADSLPQVSKFLNETARRLAGLKPVELEIIPSARPGENLVANGGFEKGVDSPARWEPIDGLTAFWEDGGPEHGKVLRLDTDVYAREVEAWQARGKKGAPASEAPKKTPTRGKKYNTIAGGQGVHFYSDPIPVKPGMKYRLAVDVKAKWAGQFFSKVFVKGYAPVLGPDGRRGERDIYKAYLACRTRTAGGDWEHFERDLHPTRWTPAVQYLRVMIFAYWPPGEYWFDNVAVTEIGVVREKPPAEATE